MSIKGIFQNLGVIDKPPIVEEVKGSAPTVFEGGKPYAYSDDGAGWAPTSDGWQREIRTTPPPAAEADKWQEHAPGAWHRKGGK